MEVECHMLPEGNVFKEQEERKGQRCEEGGELGVEGADGREGERKFTQPYPFILTNCTA